MSFDSGRRHARAVQALWETALAASAIAVLIPAFRWAWSAPHLLMLIVAVLLVDRMRLIPEKAGAVCLLAVWLLDVAWSTCYVSGIVRHGLMPH